MAITVLPIKVEIPSQVLVGVVQDQGVDLSGAVLKAVGRVNQPVKAGEVAKAVVRVRVGTVKTAIKVKKSIMDSRLL